MTTLTNGTEGVSTASTGRNYPAPPWVVGILQGIKAPINQANVLALEFWAQQEGDGVANNNPFNVCGQGAGAVTCYAQCEAGSCPIYSYSSMQAGTNHNVNQFLLSNPGLAPAVGAMRNGGSLADIYQALNGYFGKQSWASPTYPTTLYDYLQFGGQGPSAPYSSGASSNYALSATESSLPSSAPGSSGSGSGGCSTKKAVFNLDLGVGDIGLSACQLKAILGGMGIAAGALIVLSGAALLVISGLAGKGGPAAPLVAAALPVARKAQSVAGAPRRRREVKATRVATAERTANAQTRDRNRTISSDRRTIAARKPAPRISTEETASQRARPGTRPSRPSPSSSRTSPNTKTSRSPSKFGSRTGDEPF